MDTLKGTLVNLRALEPEDLQFLFNTENNPENWEISSTQVPFSKDILKRYLENAHLDIYEAKQLRLVIENTTTLQAVGMIDLFDFDPMHQRAGIGILINKEEQKKGYASDALDLLITYAFKHLNLHQLYANITSDNTKSCRLFEKFNFQYIGTKKDWIFNYPTYKDEKMYQLIRQTKQA